MKKPSLARQILSTLHEGIDRESAAQFGQRVSTEIGKQLNALDTKLRKLKNHWKMYDTSVRSGSWVNSGDLGRIRETLDSVLADLEWVD